MKKFQSILGILFSLQLMGCSLFFGNDITGNRSKNTDQQLNKKPLSQLSPQAYLKKLSFHLRGISPSLSEYQDLENSLSQGESQKFFKEKISAYLKSPQHLGRMIERLDDLFGMSLSSSPTEAEYFEIPEKIIGSSSLNSMDLLFRKVIKENLKWDVLFTGKEYQITYPAVMPSVRASDLGFFNAIRPDLPPSFDGVIGRGDDINFNINERTLLPVNFDSKDNRISGAITTSRFLSRYTTTLLNKNRARAAAVFRILLCDDMKPTIAADDDISDILKKSFPKTDITENDIIETDQIKHGTQQTCMACHQKLDPMGDTFRTTGNVLSPEVSNGALVYPTHDNRTVNIPVSGLGQLTETMTEQSEYNECQVRHFWNWFMGKDKSLTAERLHSLVQEFERLERKPNDFIAYLVSEKEFQDDDSGSFSGIFTFAQVRPLLAKCSNCHAGVSSKAIPSFVKMPFGGNKESHKKWVRRIAKSVDLSGDGTKANMPTADAGWTVSLEDRHSLRNWINQGSQDDNGVKTTDDLTIPNQDPQANNERKSGAFGNVNLRYLSSTDLLRLLKQKFPLAWEKTEATRYNIDSKNKDEVLCVNGLDRKALGFFNTATIEPSYPGPSLSYVKWLSKCILAFSKLEYQLIRKENLNFDKYLGEKAIESLAGTNLESVSKEADTFAWSKLPADIQTKIATYLVHELIGKDVALREKEIVQTAISAAASASVDTTTEALTRILLTALLQDEFLTY